MSDISAPDAPAADPAPATDPAAAPATAPTTAPEAAPEPPAGGAADPFENEGQQQFDRAYVQKLREEAAGHRTKAKTYTEVFDRFDPDSQEVLLDLARTLATDPKAGAARMKELAGLIDGEPAAPAPPDPDADVPLTKAEYAKLRADEQSAAAAKATEDAINREVADLGYTLGSREHYTLLWEAKHNHGADLSKAHEALVAERQKIVDDYVASKENEAAGTPTAGSGGAAPANSSPIKTFQDATASAEAKAKAAGFRVR